MTETGSDGVPRRVLVLAHTGREDARKVARAFVEALTGHGITVRLLAAEAADLGVEPGDFEPPLELTESETDASHECELTLVVGGDGSILRAAEVTHARLTPVLGVNLGHVGFLAEAEHDDVESTIDAIVHRRYTAEDRLTLDVERLPRRRGGGEHVRAQRGQRREGRPRADARGRRRDRRPPAVALGLRRGGVRDPDRLHGLQLLRRRADRVAAGRGAAASSRSARTRCSRGRWWSRPPRCSPSRCWPAPRAPACCGATAGAPSTCRPAPGSRYAAASTRCAWSGCTRRRSPTGWSPSSGCPSRAGGAPPSDAGDAGPMIEEIRIGSLGVIDSSTLELGPGLTVITGETGAGKTMIVTALGLLLGGRADSGAVRTGARQARVEGVVPRRRRCRVRDAFAAASTRPAERSRTTGSCWPATCRPRAGPARSSAAPRCR